MRDLQTRIQEHEQRVDDYPVTDTYSYRNKQHQRVAVGVLRAFKSILEQLKVNEQGEIIGPVPPVLAHIAQRYSHMLQEDGMLFQDPKYRGKTSISYSATTCTVNRNDLDEELGHFVGNYLCDDAYSSIEQGLILPAHDDDSNLSQAGTGLWILEHLVGPQPTLVLLDTGKQKIGSVFDTWMSAVGFIQSLVQEEGHHRMDGHSVLGKYTVVAMLYTASELPKTVMLVTPQVLAQSIP